MKLKVSLGMAVLLGASLFPATAFAGPPEHCESDIADPCKPAYILCNTVEDRTKGHVTCG